MVTEISALHTARRSLGLGGMPCCNRVGLPLNLA
jgi:hypothetical protein